MSFTSKLYFSFQKYVINANQFSDILYPIFMVFTLDIFYAGYYDNLNYGQKEKCIGFSINY